MSGVPGWLLASLVVTSGASCAEARPAMDKGGDVMARIQADFERRTERPVAERPPVRSEGGWRTADGAAITETGIVGWTRPPQQDGVPLTAYWSAAERRYWVHEGGGLGWMEAWFGPFELR